MLNVGQADATVLKAPSGETMVIDSGDWQQDGEEVIAYLEALDIDHIDHLVATHPHADHIGGHAAIIETYETEYEGVDTVWDPGVPHPTDTYERYLDAIETHDVQLIEAQAGDAIEFGELDVEVLHPPADAPREDPHGSSLVIRITHGEVTALFTGDAEEDVESALLEGDHELAATIYQAGHHGSNTSSTPAFLDAVSPAVAVISAGYDNQYGHPHEPVLERLEERSIDTYFTAVHGTVVFESDGETVSIKTQSSGPTQATELPAAEPTEAEVTAPVTHHGEVTAQIASSPPVVSGR